MTAICYLGIGSNLGNRRKNIKSAIEKIGALKGTRLLKASSIIETKPVGGPAGEPDYLNCCLKISTGFTPRELFKKLQDIEVALGRPRKHPRFDRRTIDIDILFFADKIINTKELIVPHPRIFERDFVLRPLMEIA
jgi:2-amino-4-hydroxy-6-hydroxymethyldihydropteridine diphosphokinase